MDKKMKSLSPVADFIVRIKNANITYKSIVETPTNKQIKEIAKILRLEGFIMTIRLIMKMVKKE